MRSQRATITPPSESGELDTYVGESHSIFVPPRIEITDAVTHRGAVKRKVVYPIPLELKPVAFGKGMTFFFHEAGWRRKIRTEGLITDIGEAMDGTEDDLKRFILKWGPLWNCSTHTDLTRNRHCFWRFHSWEEWHLVGESRCEWAAEESVEEFHFRLRELWAAFEIAARLLDGRPAPTEYFKMLPIPLNTGKSIPRQRFALSKSISWYLAVAGGPRIQVQWTRGKAEISISTGLGFFRSAWMQAAQLISGVKGIYWCNGCKKAFIPTGRRPPRGKNNFCAKCGKQAAKNEWALKNKDRITTKQKSLMSHPLD